MWELRFVGLLAPRPRQHGMLHPKLRLTAQEEAIEKENTATHFQAQHLFSASKLYRHCAERTMGVALPLPGCGGDASPHIRTASSAKPRSLYAQKGIVWDAHPMLPGAWGEQPHKTNPPHSKTSAPVSQTFQAVFSAFSAPVLCPKGHHLGCNIPCCRGRGASSPTK